MFSLQIIDSDAFLDMPLTSQLLYFHLAMRADDEGFIGNPKKIMRLVGTQEDDLKILIAKRFVLAFESGVLVIKHWLIHNTIRMDRFSETTYQNEKKLLKTTDNKAYTELATTRQPKGNQLATQVKLSKDNLSKVKLSEEVAKAPTPAEEAREFFNTREKQEDLINVLFQRGIPRQIAEAEIKKFVSYWTERTKSGLKQKWELQQTFELGRRIGTWFKNYKEFNNKSQEKGTLVLWAT